MKYNIVGGLAVSALLIAAPLSIASAADMPLKAPPPAPAPVYSWTGCYIGGNVGGGWAHKSADDTSFNGVPETPFSAGSTTINGWAYGGQIGCDYQLNNNLVVGIRGMWDGSNIKGSAPQPLVPFVTTNSIHYDIESFGTVVGKVGFLLAPTVELYGLGGLAWVRDSLYQTNLEVGEWAAGDQTRTGYDAGAGLAWMFARNWDLWVEYDHMGFGTKNIIIPGVGLAAGQTYGYSVTQSVDKVLLGIDYRFTWASAPAAAPLITK
jgi:outer membrane immunogenic protein